MVRLIQEVQNYPFKFVKTQTACQRLLEMPPAAHEIEMKPVLYKDPKMSFGKAFLQGMEFDFLMMHVCCLSFFIQASRFNTTMDIKLLMGILISYILDCIFVWIRKYAGRRNLSRHTLVDEVFLG